MGGRCGNKKPGFQMPNQWSKLTKDMNKNEIDELDECIIERTKMSKKRKDIFEFNKKLNQQFLSALNKDIEKERKKIKKEQHLTDEQINEHLLNLIEQSKSGEVDLYLRLPIKQFYEHCKKNNIKEIELQTHIYSEYLANKRKKDKTTVWLLILIEELKGFCKEYEIKEIEFNFNDFDNNVKETQTNEKENEMQKLCCQMENELTKAVKGSKFVWLTTPQAEKYLGIGERCLRRMIADGSIEFVDCGFSQARYLVRVRVS